eukprot:gene13450-biopygen13839
MGAALEGGSRRRKEGRVAADKRGTTHELAKQFARQLQAARVNLQMVQQRMMKQFDARHRLQQIKVNDKVWVDGQHLTLPVEQQSQRQFRDCEMVTVDILPKWQATCTEDILHWNYKLYPWYYFDVIWASPPCKEYSKAKTRGAPDMKLADRRVRLTREIIELYDPAYFFIENPAGDDALRGLHTRAVMKDLSEPLMLTTYSQDVYAIPRAALLHHLFCELKLGERMKEENALAVMDLISTLTARTDESEIQDTEAN